MYPILGEWSLGVPIRSYGVFAAIGLAIGLIIVFRAGAREEFNRRRLLDLVLWVLVSSLVFAKLSTYLVDWRVFFVDDPWTFVDLFGGPRRVPRVLVMWEGGLVYYGGLLGGALAAVIFLRGKAGQSGRKMSTARVADVIFPALSLGHVWGRLGCFMAGCCFGKAGGGSLGVAFGPDSQAYKHHASQSLLPPPFGATYNLHPVQLYSAAAELVISGALIFVLWPRRRAPGQIGLTYLTCYSALRLILELFRGDRGRGFLGDPVAMVGLNRMIGVDGGSPSILSVSQCIALLVLLISGWLWLLWVYRRKETGERTVKVGDGDPY